MFTIVSTILSLITGTLLPLLGTSAATTAMITQIISTIESLLPIISTLIPQFYTSVKNIVQALTADPSTTADQLAQLQTIDAQLDAAFEAAALAVDPDVPASTA